MIPWIYLNPPLKEGESKELREDQAHHLLRVLRLADGASLVVGDGRGNLRKSQLIVLSSKKARVLLKENLPARTEPGNSIYLAPSLIKGDKMDFVIQKAVELGAAGIIPLLTSRSIKRWPVHQVQKKLERIRNIIEGASAQSHRAVIPWVAAPVSLNGFKETIPKEADIVVCWEKEVINPLKKVLSEKKKPCSLVLVVGPEGGLADDEVDYLISLGGRTAKIGPRILRAETASLAALTIALYQLGDLT